MGSVMYAKRGSRGGEPNLFQYSVGSCDWGGGKEFEATLLASQYSGRDRATGTYVVDDRPDTIGLYPTITELTISVSFSSSRGNLKRLVHYLAGRRVPGAVGHKEL